MLLLNTLLLFMILNVFSGCISRDRISAYKEKDEYLTCQEIKLEEEQLNSYIQDLNNGSGIEVLVPFVVGITNYQRKEDTINSADRRVQRLKQMYMNKNCI